MVQPWADQPYALLPLPGQPGQRTTTNAPVLAIAVEMAHVHNLILRGMNAIYQQCSSVSNPSDMADFITYVKTWCDMLHHHHAMEELHAFPKWDDIARAAGAEGSISRGNIAQHRAFEAGFAAFRSYIEALASGCASYDGTRVREGLHSFAATLNAHLHDEVDMILDMEKYDGRALKRVMDDAARVSVQSADPHLVLPMLFGCCDKTAAGTENFPPVPFFVPYLSHFWFARKHRSVWRFNPCDDWGRPRPLAFLGPSET